MKCEHCDAELQPGNRFCIGCGRPAEGVAATARPAASDSPTLTAEPTATPGVAPPGPDVGTQSLSTPDIALPGSATRAFPAPDAAPPSPGAQSLSASDETVLAGGAPPAPEAPALIGQMASAPPTETVVGGPGGLPPVGGPAYPAGGPQVAVAPQAGSPTARSNLGPKVTAFLRRLVADHWAAAIRMATLTLVTGTLIHAIPGLLGAIANLVRDGVAPDPLGDFFRLPFQGLLAGSGGVAGIGLWPTGVAITLVAAGTAWRLQGGSGVPADLVGRLALGVKASLLYSAILLVLSYLIEARGFSLSPSIDLPGDLSGLSSINRWARPQLVLLTVIVVAISLAGMQLAELLPRRPELAAAVRAAIRASLGLTLAAGVLTTTAAALHLPPEPDAPRWLAQGFEFFGTATMAILDIGGHQLSSAIGVLFGDRSVDPIRGPWVPVIIIAAVVVGVVAIRRWYDQWGSAVGLVAGVAAAIVPGLGLILIDAMDGLGGETVTAAVILAVLIPVLVVLTTPEAMGQIRSLLTPRPTGESALPETEWRQDATVCHSCGTPRRDSSQFCGRCGAPAT